MKRLIVSSMFVAAALGAIAPAGAAVTIPVTVTVDLSTASYTPNSFAVSGVLPANLQPSFSVSTGDSIDYKIKFATGQSVFVKALSTVGAFFFPELTQKNGSGNITQNGSLSLLDANGNAFLTSTAVTDADDNVIGQAFLDSDFGAFPANGVTFYGVEYQGTIGSYAGNATTRTFFNPQLTIGADQYAISGVPEAATWAMMLMGFGFTGAALRRRRPVNVGVSFS